ncbi:MAG: class I SAM-dependent methyltransferase [Candidatus Hydrogenedentes bacterium]|nr:class I SAM-dependent methyltransferase [Candidatus Hydrogenedentota bacterium]
MSKRITALAQYHYINTIDARDHEVRLMNYGWIDPETRAPSMPLDSEDEPDRHALQLYHRVVSGVDLRDKDVLEVGCGRGGGAAYIAKYLGPRLVHGMDFCPSSVAFCSAYWKRPCLTFSVGSAERLKQSDGSFDAIVNVESSHCYVNMRGFVSHSFRVLRPGGHMLFADFRHAGLIDALREDLLRPGFEMIEEECLNPGVMLALDADDERKRAFIEARVHKRRMQMFEMFAAVKGSPLYCAFESGDAHYVRFVLRKPDTPSSSE